MTHPGLKKRGAIGDGLFVAGYLNDFDGVAVGIETRDFQLASIAAQHGMSPLHVVSEHLGHSSIRITLDIYGHPIDDDDQGERAAAAMAAALYGKASAEDYESPRDVTSQGVEGPALSDSP